MTATLQSIDAKLTVAAPYLHDGCKHEEALAYIDRLLDARWIVAGMVPCPSPPT